MATKTVTLKGGQLMDTDEDYVGWVADDSSGLHFVAEEDTGASQQAYSTLTHMVTETSNPIWNEITYRGTYNTVTSDLYSGHITLQGIKDDGTLEDIMEIPELEGSTATATNRFNLLGSSCTNDMYTQTPAGAASAGTIEVNLPLRYGKYEDVDLMPSWFDEDWGYRDALPLERTTGQRHGANGHYTDYYGYNVYVPYDANMADNIQTDVRFTGPDGVTECPFFQLNVVAGTGASYIVMIPWGFLDKEKETFTRYGLTGPAHAQPLWLYVYYGNASATSGSDVTLGGNALFGDDFSSDDGTWTLSAPANSTATIANGVLELRSTASQTSTPYCTANYDYSGSFGSSWEIIWKIVYDTPVYSNTTVSNGPYLRISGRDNTGSGGSDETASYWEVKHFYITNAADTELGQIGGSHFWGYAYYDSGVTGGTNYSYKLSNAIGDTQFIKARYHKRDSASGGSNVMIWYHSDDGVNWNLIGSTQNLTAVFDTVTLLRLQMFYVGKSGVAADKYIQFDAVMAYPIMTGGCQTLDIQEHFHNDVFLDRFYQINNIETDATHYRRHTESGNRIQARSVGVDCIWSAATRNPLCLYTGGLDQVANADNEMTILECTVDEISENATAGVVQEFGVAAFDNSTLASSNSSLFGIRWTATGASRTFYRTTFIAGAADLDTSFGTWTQADLPIKLRLIFDPVNRTVCYDARKIGSGGDWERLYVSPTAYQRNITGTYNAAMLYMRTGTANSSLGYFSSFRVYNGSGVIDSGIAYDYSQWMGEESLADDYPLALVAPDEDEQSLVFTSPTPMKRGNAMKLRTKDFGGDYNYSKPFYITDQDQIDVGPSGTDQYIGMRLVFDFNMAATDEIEYDQIEFTYEVI